VVDWLLRYDIGKVIKTIVDDEKFSEYALPKKPTERKEQRRRGAVEQNRTGDLEL
jgi:hypothetical protein